MKKVLDISNVNPANEATVKASGAVALICKATEGTNFLDKVYPGARAIAKSLKIPFGGYVFHHPDEDGASQAKTFLTYALPKVGDIQPIIDTETQNGKSWAEIAASVNATAKALEAAGFAPIIYGSTSWLENLYAALPELKRLPVWQAEYNSFLHRIPGVRVLLWQFTSSWAVGRGRFDGSYLLVPSLIPLLVPTRKTKPKAPAWYVKTRTLSPLWAWIVWRDNGAPSLWRPTQVPHKIPAAWWARYAVHKGLKK